MKTLKLDHQLAQEVLSGIKTSTIRLYDDKDLSVNDQVELVDRVNHDDRASWRTIGIAEITEVNEKRIRDIIEQDLDGYTEYKTKDELVTSMRQYYGQQVDQDTPVKIVKFRFKAHQSPQSVGQLPEPLKVSNTTIKLFADGGSRGNPGPSAAGFVLIDDHDVVIRKGGEYLGITTNNQAEYQALRIALEEAFKSGIKEVAVHMDSLLVVNQMKGVFKVKNRDLWPIHESIKELCGRFKKVTFTHVPRELNRLADTEVNEILDAQMGKSA